MVEVAKWLSLANLCIYLFVYVSFVYFSVHNYSVTLDDNNVSSSGA